MEEQTKGKFTKRKYLCGGASHRPRVFVDMEQVYKDLDNKMSLEEVADKHHVSVTTLRRRHKKYQEAIALMEKESEESEGYTLPPLPPGI